MTNNEIITFITHIYTHGIKIEINSSNIDLFAYLFLIYNYEIDQHKSFEYQYELTTRIGDCLDAVPLSQELRKYIEKFNDYEFNYNFDKDEKELFTKQLIAALNYNDFYFNDTYTEQTFFENYSIVLDLLDIKKDQKFGIIYSSLLPKQKEVVWEKLFRNEFGSVDNKCTVQSFSDSQEAWFFHKVMSRVNIENYKYYNEEIINDNLYELKSFGKYHFDKMFVFPPFFQKIQEKNSNNIRLVHNMMRAEEDKSVDLINQALSYLNVRGKALVLVSNSIFNKKYSNFHKELIENKKLTAVINLPLGYVYPNNISASFLFFENKKSNKGMWFLDLRNEKKEMVDILIKKELFKDYYERSRFVTYALIKHNNFDLSFSTYRNQPTPADQYVIPEYEDDYDYDYNSDNNTAPKYNIQNFNNLFVTDSSNPTTISPYILGKETTIFKGILDNKLQPASENTKDKVRLLRIADIEENRISNTMPLVDRPDHEYDKFSLKKGDLVIAKTANPLKIAVFDKISYDNGEIYASANLFIIRINEGSDLNPFYLKVFLESSEGRNELIRLSSGSTLTSFTKGNLELINIPRRSPFYQEQIKEDYISYEKQILKLREELEKYRYLQLRLLKKSEE